MLDERAGSGDEDASRLGQVAGRNSRAVPRPRDARHHVGHETLAVDYLKKVLDAQGVPTKTFAMKPTRANLVARLKGNGSKRPLLILAHTDVVGVQREKWPVDPFGAVIKGGDVWAAAARTISRC
jgi:acetylornithine deacetylase/succinyl-diaminopimelate desuccinylase-like protein